MLIDCPECQKSVSNEALTCPHCGYQLLGRENLVRCQKCNADVIPKTNPHGTISKYCPLCSQPLTNMGARNIFLLLFIIIFVGVLIFLLTEFSNW